MKKQDGTPAKQMINAQKELIRMETPKKHICPCCGQEAENTGWMTPRWMRYILADKLSRMALEALEESKEPAVVERALRILETLKDT